MSAAPVTRPAPGALSPGLLHWLRDTLVAAERNAAHQAATTRRLPERWADEHGRLAVLLRSLGCGFRIETYLGNLSLTIVGDDRAAPARAALETKLGR